MEIKTERLVLRPLGIKNLYTTILYSLSYENTLYMCHLPYDTEDEVKEHLLNVQKEWTKEKPQFLEFAVLYQKEHIGMVAIYFNDRIGELSWIIQKDYWRNGFAYEASKALIEYVNEEMKITHFRAHCDALNIASYKLMEKLGMKKTSLGKRKNRLAKEESLEYQYELYIENSSS